MCGCRLHLAVGQTMGSHCGVSAPPILIYFSGDWDVHWGYDLDFDPWPYIGGHAHLVLHDRPI